MDGIDQSGTFKVNIIAIQSIKNIQNRFMCGLYWWIKGAILNINILREVGIYFANEKVNSEFSFENKKKENAIDINWITRCHLSK